MSALNEKCSKKHHLGKIYRKSIEHLSNINGTSIDVYRCPCIPMDVYGCPRISDESRKSQISHPSKIENLIIRSFFFPCSGPTVADNNVFGCILSFFFSLGFGSQQRVTCYLWCDPSHTKGVKVLAIPAGINDDHHSMETHLLRSSS